MLTLPLLVAATAFVLGVQSGAILVAGIIAIGERHTNPTPIPAPTSRRTFAGYERWLARRAA